MRIFFLIAFLLPLAKVSAQKKWNPIDPNATKETKLLFKNLSKLSKKHILFGHQHATEYGHGWASWEEGHEDQSDVKSVCGSHPAVIGVDFSCFSVNKDQRTLWAREALKNNIINTYNRGGIITAAWHFYNPLSEGGFYWKDSVSKPSVRYLMPGGESHHIYKEILNDLGSWAKELKGDDGSLAPVIFRPYHEMDGDWFWWGRSHCTADEFVSLWQFTVDYLRDSLDVHNFLYAYSPDNRFLDEATFLERYPGDEYVDMVGMDNYGDMGRDGYRLDTAALKLKIVADYAKKHKKLAAFTETGLESIPDTTWWTNSLLHALRSKRLRLSYVLVWRNDIKSPTHYYAPYPGQVSENDFLNFFNHRYTLFENDLKDIYGRGTVSSK